MKLKIIKMNGQSIILKYTSFEFRANRVSNWIKVINNKDIYRIADVATIEYIS